MHVTGDRHSVQLCCGALSGCGSGGLVCTIRVACMCSLMQWQVTELNHFEQHAVQRVTLSQLTPNSIQHARS